MKMKKILGMLTASLLVIALNAFQPKHCITVNNEDVFVTPVAQAETVEQDSSEDDEVIVDFYGEQLSEFKTHLYKVKDKFINNKNVLSDGKKPKFYKEKGIDFKCINTEFGVFYPDSYGWGVESSNAITMYAVVLLGKCTNLKYNFQYYESYIYLFDKEQNLLCKGRTRCGKDKSVIDGFEMRWDISDTPEEREKEKFFWLRDTHWITTDNGELKYIKNQSKIINVGKVKESKYNVRLNMIHLNLNKYKKKDKSIYDMFMNNIGFCDFINTQYSKALYYGQQKVKNGYKITIIDAVNNKKMSFVVNDCEKIWSTILFTDDGSEYYCYVKYIKKNLYITNHETSAEISERGVKIYNICKHISYEDLLTDKNKWKTLQSISGTRIVKGKIYFVVEQLKLRYTGDDWESKSSVYILKDINGKTIIKAKTKDEFKMKLKKFKEKWEA